MSEDGLPPLRDVIERHGIAPTKALGQNFLLDLNLTRKVARGAGTLKGVTVLEVGPGPGGLTRALLMEGANVVAIERDSRCLPALEEIAAHYPGRLTVMAADALKIDPRDVLPADGTGKIISNLPYNIGTELLTRWVAVENWPPVWASLTLMFQREVAERIVATPDDDAYGRLGVLCGWRCQSTILFDIPARAFTPPPKVTSSVVHLTPLAAPLSVGLIALETITRHAFGQRRKMLRQSLKPVGGETVLAQAGIDPTRRAETLDVAEFVALARAYEMGSLSRSSTNS
ncbi:MAG: 16S rRNA (adenine(1518)-N(6)/adenine(1519)-N(6))-dimethyltransferase RsmA [Phyllobacteriaceae bacterium]|nr:16S rRNA (adenine(1518)-N(6)/adenine(1519)-N(6))-dimethyltransferase RsmA [Phyllobacteriaceae bacterium]